MSTGQPEDSARGRDPVTEAVAEPDAPPAAGPPGTAPAADPAAGEAELRHQLTVAHGLAKLAQSRHREKVPVVDDEGLAIAAGAELRGATILPPTRAGWQRFLELAPASGESFTSLKEIGLSWWGRKVPQDLLSKERNLLRKLIVPRLLEDTAYRNARENSDPQNARIEHDKALGRVMLDLFTEDAETHGELYKRYADDDAFRRSLHEQSFAATYPPEKKPDAGPGFGKGAATASEPRITDEQWVQLQALFEDGSRRDHAEPPEDVDRRVIDNLFLQRAAMGDALAMAGMGKREQAQQAEQAMHTAHRVTALRAEASVLRGRGYGVSLAGAPERAFLLIGLGGQVLAARLIAPVDKVVFAPGIDAETRTRIDRDVEHARQVVEEIMQEEHGKAGSQLTEDVMLAVWRRARQGGGGDRGGGDVSAQPQAPVNGDTVSVQPAADASITLRIERPASGSLRAMAIRKSVRSLEEASREYLGAVDASGEGASTFPRGLVVLPDGQEHDVSFNGRIWSGDRLLFDPAKSTQAGASAPLLPADPPRPAKLHSADFLPAGVLASAFALRKPRRPQAGEFLYTIAGWTFLFHSAGRPDERKTTMVVVSPDVREPTLEGNTLPDAIAFARGWAIYYDLDGLRRTPPERIEEKTLDVTTKLRRDGEWYVIEDSDVRDRRPIGARLFRIGGAPNLPGIVLRLTNSGKAVKVTATGPGAASWSPPETTLGSSWSEDPYGETVTFVSDSPTVVDDLRAALPALELDTSEYTPKPPKRGEPDRPYDEARSAIKALGLPAKKYAYYVKQAENAIAGGKDFRPIVERARKADVKSKGETRGSVATQPAATAQRTTKPRIIDVALDTFNAEPRWRLAQLRTRPNGHVLVVYPEGHDPDAAVAAIDIDMENVDDVRWIAPISPADQDAILERLDRALWAAFEVREEEEGVPEGEERTPIPSPIQHLIELMERRSLSLGARGQPVSTQYPAIARALQDLATPAGASAEEMQTWLESNHLMAAGEVVARSRTEPVHVRKLMQDLWDSILEELEVVEVDETDSTLWVPDAAIFDVNNHETILERAQDGESFVLRRHRLEDSFRGQPDDDGRVAVRDVKGDLMPGALVHLRGHANERMLAELYRKVREFRHNLVQAPKTLKDVRTLLYWTAVMLDAPLCQGEVKQRATAAFEQAKAYYDTAHRQVVEGVTVDALRRMHEALRRISAAAAEIAKSCGEGQLEIAGTQPDLPVRPEDRAALAMPNAAASAWIDLARSPDGSKVRATIAGPKAQEWTRLHPTLLGKHWSTGASGPFIEFNYSDVIERRIRGEVGDLSVSLVNWDGPFIPPRAVELLVATLRRPDLAPLREQTRRHQIPPASLAVLPLDPREARDEEPEHGYGLALHLPDGRGFMFQLDNFAPVTAADLHEPANLWHWGSKDDPDTEAVLLARGLDWDAIAALLGLDPADLRPSGRAAPPPSATTHRTIDTRGLGPRTRALLASAAAKTRRGA